jgi:hypothetical protein
MKKFKPLEELEKKYFINKDECLARGSRGKIYRVGQGIVTKIPFDITSGNLRNDRKALFDLFKEYNNQELAVELGIKFPKPYGIYAIKENKSGLYFPGLAMDEVNGKDFNQLEGKALDNARILRDAEIEKLSNAGLIFADNHKGNAMWTPLGVYLLDADGLNFSISY